MQDGEGSMVGPCLWGGGTNSQRSCRQHTRQPCRMVRGREPTWAQGPTWGADGPCLPLPHLGGFRLVLPRGPEAVKHTSRLE